MESDRRMIRMRDGVRLETFVFRPDGVGPFPALLARCMYGTKSQEGRAERFGAEGYAVALQNVRGRLGSEGDLPGRSSTPEDGYDTIEWLVQQPWCNGRVGTFGASALARVQTATAFLGHPAHRAMCPQVLPFGMMSRLGGAMMVHQPPMWLYYAQSGAALRPYDQIDWMPHLRTLPVTSILDDLGGPIELYRDVVTDPRDYFDLMDPDHFRQLHTPNLMVTGWYDHCGTGPIDFFTLTHRHAPRFQTRNTHLVVGPWDHSCTPDGIDEYDFGPDARRDHAAHEIAFFDRHLKEDTSGPAPPPVRIFVMGRNEWRDEPAWPLERAADTEFFLHADGALSADPPGSEPPDSFTYDPADPVPTIGGANSGPARALPMGRGPRDQRPVLGRDDVLLYQSEPLTGPLEVTGPLKMVLFAASSAVDTDFTAKLMDMSPDGDARLLTDGVIRARHRNGRGREDFVTPGEVARYEIDLWFTSNEFQPGHRIAVAVSSSNFPRLGRNLNTGGDNVRDSHFVAADQTIFHDAARPSRLRLPIVPGG
ncbi:MAG: CocE/NonD family hydrolase [Planctomycetota bacterium]